MASGAKWGGPSPRARREAVHNPALLYPMFALAAWTLLVLVLLWVKAGAHLIATTP